MIDGKLLYQANPFTDTWDGIYNGQLMPPSDYWHVLELTDSQGNYERRSGHFTLKQYFVNNLSKRNLEKETTMDLVNKGFMLPLMEEFYTIQGEGFHKGTAAYFIRVGGCDVGCHWCDVKESWDADKHPPTKTNQIVKNAAAYSDTIVVTGGEPLTWDMGPLTIGLKAEAYKPI